MARQRMALAQDSTAADGTAADGTAQMASPCLIFENRGLHSSRNIYFYFPYLWKAVVFDSNVFLLEQYNTYNIPIQPTHENLLCSNRTQALSVAEKTPVLEADIPNANLRCTVSLPYEFTQLFSSSGKKNEDYKIIRAMYKNTYKRMFPTVFVENLLNYDIPILNSIIHPLKIIQE